MRLPSGSRIRTWVMARMARLWSQLAPRKQAGEIASVVMEAVRPRKTGQPFTFRGCSMTAEVNLDTWDGTVPAVGARETSAAAVEVGSSWGGDCTLGDAQPCGCCHAFIPCRGRGSVRDAGRRSRRARRPKLATISADQAPVAGRSFERSGYSTWLTWERFQWVSQLVTPGGYRLGSELSMRRGKIHERYGGRRASRRTAETTRRRRSSSIEPVATVDLEAARLQLRTDALFQALGCSSSEVLVEVRSDTREFAYACGTTVFNKPIGQIVVSRARLDLLPDDELQFVLAHEAAHVFFGHNIETLAFKLSRFVLDALGKERPGLRIALASWDLWKLVRATRGDLPPDALAIRQHELEADRLAVCLTGDKGAAKRCLLRLVGGNVNAPSHTWEVFSKTLPALSIADRLAALDELDELPVF